MSSQIELASSARYRLRPGGEIVRVSPDCLQIVFANYTATFKGFPVIRALESLLLLLEKHSSSGLLASSKQGERTKSEVDEFAFGLLLSNHCLVEVTDCEPNQWNGPDHSILETLGIAAGSARKRLAKKCILVVCAASVQRCFSDVEAAIGVPFATIPVHEGDEWSLVAEKLSSRQESLSSETELIVLLYGFPYGSGIAAHANEWLYTRKITSFFAGVHGGVGRVGPLVIPGVSACLECLHVRLSLASGPNDSGISVARRQSKQGRAPSNEPVHDGFERCISSYALMELARICLSLSGDLLGAYMDMSFLRPAVTRRSFLRVPGCQVCGKTKSICYSWDAVQPIISISDDE